VNNNVFDVYSTVIFAIFGYFCNKLRMEPAPLLIGFVLGPMMEEHLRRAMLLSRGDPIVFLERPISATLLAIGAIALATMLMPNIRKKKDEALAE
jgi:putative tricarboxylic transport membrane protein